MNYTVFFFIVLVLFAPLVSAQDIEFQEYGKNPVFDPLTRAYYPTVLFDKNRFSGHGDSAYYKMWYSDGGLNGTYVTQSEDGIVWTNNKSTTGISDSHHCQVVYFSQGFSGANSGLNPSSATMYYRLWYWDTVLTPPDIVPYSINSIRYAESQNGINWFNDQAIQQVGLTVVDNTVASNWNRGSYGPINIIYNANGSSSLDDSNVWNNKFVMYYDGTTGGYEEIGLAYSTNGILWKGYGRVLERGGSGTWDSDYAAYGTVVNIGDTWHLWYSGGQTQVGDGIGHATSSDGINWQKDPANPIFHKNNGVVWRNVRTYTPSIIFDPKGFETGKCPNLKMWFTGRTGSEYTIGYANTCVNVQTTKKVNPTILYSVKIVDVSAPSLKLNNYVDNKMKIGVENRGLLKAHDVELTVENCPDCIKIKITPDSADIPSRSTYFYEVSINPNCDPGKYKIKFKAEGKNISQVEEFEFEIK